MYRQGDDRSGLYGWATGITAGLLLALGVTSAASAADNLVNNGGFENGTTGWGWEQWDNKPLPGIIDKQDHSEGTASFKMGLPGASGPRWISTEVPLKGITKDCTLTFFLKGKDLPPNDAYVRVGVEGKGWLGSELGKSDVAQVGGTFDWKQFSVPIPAAKIKGSSRLTLFFYHDNMGKGTFWFDGISITSGKDAATAQKSPAPAPAPAPAAPAKAPSVAAEAANLVVNGGFDDVSMTGWGWEQWDNKPLPGVVDKQDRAEGTGSFKMGLGGASGVRYLSQEIKLKETGKAYLLSFWMKANGVPANAAHVRVGIEGRGWLGSVTGQSEAAQTGGTHDWKQFTVPISADAIGTSPKLTLFFYHDQMGQGTVWIDGVLLKAVAAEVAAAAVGGGGGDGGGGGGGSGATLTGDTSHPVLSTYAQGEKVELNFRASGLDSKPVNLLLDIVDEHDQRIESREVPVKPAAAGTWTMTITAPSDKLGFYRVKARLSSGVEVARLGTRKAGFITYCIVPDPAKRTNYGEMESMFAMQGGFGPWGNESLAYLGARWVLDSSLEWKKNEPNRAGEFAEALAAGKVSVKPETDRKWQTWGLPTLMAAPQWAVVPDTCPYMTGVLTPEGEKAWADYCKQAARVYMQRNPDCQQRIYQITWEPIYPWGFKGRNEDLVRIYEIAYAALHEVDPKAVVAGPCRGINRNDVEATIPLLKLGLGKYTDMYSTHPYFSIDCEKDGFVRELRKMTQALSTYTGKKLPMIGTEQGWSTEEELSKEITQARGLIRQNLITLGEGYRFNFTYYIVDYVMGEQKGYGYYYNLVEGVPWGPAKAAPRPIVPAYAAQSFLLDGHQPAGAIEWLGETAWGYAFQRQDHVVLALWDYGEKPTEVAIPAGLSRVQVYDWMGNELSVPNDSGVITLKLGPEPIYVAGVSPSIWGTGAGRLLQVDSEQLQVYPGGRATVSGKVTMPADQSFNGSVVLDIDPRLGSAPAPQQVSVAANQSLSYTFDIAMGANAIPGVYPVKVLLKSPSGTLAAAGARLRLASPVAITAMDPAAVPGNVMGVAVTLADERGAGFKGTLNMELDGQPATRRQIVVSLPPGGAQRFIAPYRDIALPASHLYQFKATVTAENGYSFTQTAPVNFLLAQRTSGAVAIDGDPAKWNATPAVTLSGKEMVIRSAEYYRDDLSAELRYAWDDQAVYVIARVNDANFYQPNTGVSIWKGDCLQLAFNLDPRKKEAKTGNLLDTNILRRATEINVALTPQGPEAYRSTTYDSVGLPCGRLSDDQVKLAIKKDDAGLFYEIAISWKALGADAPPKEGDLIGVAAAVNDVDSAEQKDPTALGLYGGICPTKESEKFGVMLLGGASR